MPIRWCSKQQPSYQNAAPLWCVSSQNHPLILAICERLYGLTKQGLAHGDTTETQIDRAQPRNAGDSTLPSVEMVEQGVGWPGREPYPTYFGTASGWNEQRSMNYYGTPICSVSVIAQHLLSLEANRCNAASPVAQAMYLPYTRRPYLPFVFTAHAPAATCWLRTLILTLTPTLTLALTLNVTHAAMSPETAVLFSKGTGTIMTTMDKRLRERALDSNAHGEERTQ
eukprot:6201877-Pleurochrysis_carterae.AAC.3